MDSLVIALVSVNLSISVWILKEMYENKGTMWNYGARIKSLEKEVFKD